ncbi:glycogen synthase [Candidatus Spongiihabitans sp.]|uniref:glycogen synthase n=1 Tax=Candidatus Spongiihabitans sp. TaxID=3101308 RepID=UPI003C7E10B2
MRIWLVAAENGALKGGKVGGIADVIRDLPPALAARGHQVTVITPAYGIFNKLPQARHIEDFQVRFGGAQHSAQIWQIPQPQIQQSAPAVEFIAIEHALLSPKGAGVIYHDDGPTAPYAIDASRFAFFCAAVVAQVEQCAHPPDVLHLHDWHMGLVLALRHYDASLKKIRAIRIVVTIHNLAFQGIRPLKNHPSSLAAWFPRLRYQRGQIGDPRYPDCVNPMATAIRLADKLNTVSPTYAREILQPNDRVRGFSGGEGLEDDLGAAAAENRLTGILNGCAYVNSDGSRSDRRWRGGHRPGWSRLLQAIAGEKHLLKNNLTARQTLNQLPRKRPSKLLISIGRIGEQKVSLFLQPTKTHACALEMILEQHGAAMVFIMLGSGDSELEKRLRAIAAAHRNFLLLTGYSETLADLLYGAGDLFLMPSSFEPCGISQMLAMRAGQPCVVHAVGGLKDTVTQAVNGFTFGGETPSDQAENFVSSVNQALLIKSTDNGRWQKIRNHASAMRFSWEAAAAAYISDLYEFAD